MKDVVKELHPLVDQGFVAGAVVLVGNREGILAVETVGYADAVARRPMQPDAMFWIASQTKPMTATAVMMLVEEGKVGLDDPVEKHLPELKGFWVTAEQDEQHMLLRRPKRALTVRDVLSHTSGLPARTPLEEPTRDRYALRDLVRHFVMAPLLFEPGEGYMYSNVGMAVAGRLVEVLSGMSYAEFMQTRLLDPLGMTETTFWPSKAQIARLAHVHKPAADGMTLTVIKNELMREPLDDRNRHPMPGGGLFGTAQDCERFCRLFLNRGVFAGKRLLSEATVQEMTKRQTPANVTESYGLGWQIWGGGSYGHGGAYATNMRVEPARGLSLVYLVQHSGFRGTGATGQELFQKAAREQFGAPASA